MGKPSRAELEEQSRKARDEQKYPTAKYTVVVQLSPKSALSPGLVTMVFVIPSGRLTEPTFQEFRDAAEKGGCEIRMFSVGDSGIEETKWELMTYGATKLM